MPVRPLGKLGKLGNVGFVAGDGISIVLDFPGNFSKVRNDSIISSLFIFRACRKNSFIPSTTSGCRGLFLLSSGVLVSISCGLPGDSTVSVLVGESPSLKLLSLMGVPCPLGGALPLVWSLSIPVPVRLDCEPLFYFFDCGNPGRNGPAVLGSNPVPPRDT